MNRRNLPLILMLVAGAITCIITLARGYSVLGSLVALFAVLVIFYFLGSVMKWTLDYFDRENEKKNQEQEQSGEAEAEDGEEDQNQQGV